MPQTSKDLFDDSVMTFGEHLEALRTHLIKALLGAALTVILCLYYGDAIMNLIRKPIDDALDRHGLTKQVVGDVKGFSLWEYMKSWFTEQPEPKPEGPPVDAKVTAPGAAYEIKIQLPAQDLAAELHRLDPDVYPEPSQRLEGELISIRAISDAFAQLREAVARIDRPVALNVQEAFMTYLKVSVIAGFVLASPWVFYQLWLFVAAGLYPHERKYVYIYLPMSLGLFLGGAVFCFYAVFPFVLDFLLQFNYDLKIQPQIRISEWISFAVMMPLMFGISFQLPLVMLFLERISVFGVDDYRQKRRLAILTISFLSMVLTPADPVSMLLMLVPLLILYEFGILLCKSKTENSPFGAEAA